MGAVKRSELTSNSSRQGALSTRQVVTELDLIPEGTEDGREVGTSKVGPRAKIGERIEFVAGNCEQCGSIRRSIGAAPSPADCPLIVILLIMSSSIF